MAKKKYYAVRVGKKPGIYETWEQCKEQVDGVSGAQYKSFSTLPEAETYLLGTDADDSVTISDELNVQVEKKIALLGEQEIISFVDGSFDVKEEKSAFGVIILSHNGNKDILYKAFTKQLGEEFISLRNVAAELEGVKEAINWAIQYNKKIITIYFDYEGIEKWATGQWKANNNITKEDVSFMQEKKRRIEEFIRGI